MIAPFILRAVCLGLISAAFVSPGIAEPLGLETPIRIESGMITGTAGQQDTIAVFKGIPFAAAPTGDLRWRPPVAPARWDGILHADRFSDSCMQNVRHRPYLPWTEEYMVGNDVSENSLALNIWTPAKRPNEKLPVFVYIHGGAFSGGSGAVALYNGEGLAKKGIIVVTINYRLGIFGFLTHPELSAESPHASSGNYGLLDQIAALKWIQRNIGAFGGDPENVTLGGQSAGARSVNLLMASPLAKGLFHRAIVQSGLWGHRRSWPTLAEGEALGTEFGKKIGAASLSELRALPAEELFRKYLQANVRFRPVVDGWIVPDQVAEMFRSGGQIDIPTLTGFTADEGSNRPGYQTTTLADFTTYVHEQYQDTAEAVLKLYPVSNDKEAAEAQKQLWRDERSANLLYCSNLRAETGKTGDYNYYFERAIPWPEHPEYQVFHSGELPYMFNNLDMMERPWSDIDRRVADQMSSYWVNFIRSGDPNGPGLPVWPEDDSMIMRIGEHTRAENILSEEKQSLLGRILEP